MLNAESAKCGVGTGSYAWGDACTVTTVTDSSVVNHLYDDLGMKNPYNNSQGKADFIGTSGAPDADGEITLVVNGTEIRVRQRVNSTVTLDTTVDQAS